MFLALAQPLAADPWRPASVLASGSVEDALSHPSFPPRARAAPTSTDAADSSRGFGVSNGARPSAVEMVLAARLSNVSVVWPTGSTVHADAMTVHVPRNPAERRPSNFSVAAARPMPLAPLVVGQGKAIHPKDFSSRAQCLKRQECQRSPPAVRRQEKKPKR